MCMKLGRNDMGCLLHQVLQFFWSLGVSRIKYTGTSKSIRFMFQTIDYQTMIVAIWFRIYNDRLIDFFFI
jgi:hypothetical protein